MNVAITGGAGFIGSNLTKKLIQNGHKVTVFDKIDFSDAYRLSEIKENFSFVSLDITNFDLIKNALTDFDVVGHFSASADIALGLNNTFTDIREGTIATYNILESMRLNNIKKIIFPSSSTVYGNPSKIPTSEDTGLLFPISLYGASKLSSEGLISAYCHLFGLQSWIFRLGNVVGSDMTRGVIKDFISKLTNNPKHLKVLGNGLQQKDFVHIDDFLNAVMHCFLKSDEIINIFNLSSGTTIDVKKITKMVIEEMNLKDVQISYTGGNSGWPGDSPLVHYDISKIKNIGWSPNYDSEQAVKLSIKQTLLRQQN